MIRGGFIVSQCRHSCLMTKSYAKSLREQKTTLTASSISTSFGLFTWLVPSFPLWTSFGFFSRKKLKRKKATFSFLESEQIETGTNPNSWLGDLCSLGKSQAHLQIGFVCAEALHRVASGAQWEASFPHFDKHSEESEEEVQTGPKTPRKAAESPENQGLFGQEKTQNFQVSFSHSNYSLQNYQAEFTRKTPEAD